jgi:hypothetical protein
MRQRSSLIVISVLFILTLMDSNSRAEKYTTNSTAYILEKFKAYDIVFLGTTHKQTPILNFISDLTPKLHSAGVSHICLEIASDQQNNIDHFIQTGTGLSAIELAQPMDCLEYRSRESQTLTSGRKAAVSLSEPRLAAYTVGKMHYADISKKLIFLCLLKIE